MTRTAKIVLACVLTPVALIGAFVGVAVFKYVTYDLPGTPLDEFAQKAPPLSNAREVADALDAYAQPRFEILRDGKFGRFRLAEPDHAGINQLKVDTDHERETVRRVNDSQCDYGVYILHCAPRPDHAAYDGTPSMERLYSNTGPQSGGSDTGTHGLPTQPEEELSNRVNHDRYPLDGAREYRTADGSWEAYVRPVRASKTSCLSCHRTAKQGDVLGGMVYIVRSVPRNRVAGSNTPAEVQAASTVSRSDQSHAIDNPDDLE